MIEIDLLLKNIKQLVNPAADDAVRGQWLNSLRLLENVWLGGRGETINFIGFERDFQNNCRLRPEAVTIDCSDFVVMPGFVDPHTHLPFAGTRQDEFQQKLQGVSYQEIARQGGGIVKTVRQTRQIEANELVALCEHRLDQMLLSGTTTCEAKSGYGLDRVTELKQLESLQAVAALHPIDIVPTFMGAHDVPGEFSAKNREFLDFLLREVLPEVKRRNLAEYVDIFCEEGYFSLADADYYLEQAGRLGFTLKVHADEFTSNGAAAMAARRNAVSAEHLLAITTDEIDTLAASDTVAVLLPGVPFFLRLNRYAPVRQLVQKNGIVALGSDFNPGSSMVSSQLFIFYLAVFMMGMTIEEALNAVTINAACAVNRQGRLGSLAVGKKMDALLLEIADYRYLAYHLGISPVHTVIKSGEIVVQEKRIVFR